MKCKKKQQCSLYLNVVMAMQSIESVQGVAVCMGPAGMLEQCTAIYFRGPGRKRLQGQQVKVRNDCFEVRASQEVRVTLRTVPEYCDLTWSQVYSVQGCNNEDLRNNVPECITGKIEYTVDMERRELSVTVQDMLEDKDYHLRLCHRSYTCSGTGAHVLIKKENPFKNVTFRYSRLLPCLCIEGWSHMTDAPRVQVCPFKNCTEELWSEMSFDIRGEVLSWEPSCPTDAVVTLCQAVQESDCVDLLNSSQVIRRGKVTYSKVDPHPQLCMKFTMRDGVWVRCPFASGKFPVWDLMVTTRARRHEAVLTSQMKNQFSLSVCRKGEAFTCTEITTVTVDKENDTAVSLPADVCDPDVCVQVKRADIQFSAAVLRCHLPCINRDPVIWDLEQMLFLGLACLTAVVIAALAANIVLTVYQRRSLKDGHAGGWLCAPRGAAHCQTAMVILLYTPEDEAHAHLVKDLEKFLTSLNLSVKLTDLDKGQVEQTLFAGLLGTITMLLWSKGCSRHIGRLSRSKAWDPSPKVACPPSLVIRCDMVTYDTCTMASGEVPSWLSAIPLEQVKYLLTQGYSPEKFSTQQQLLTFGNYNTHIQSSNPNTVHSEHCEKANLLGFST
ncbi:interleukin-17 receptor E-like [Scleropages formosus]|nr:interleukin-17 receptor E-like [Scleropages formosus]